MQLHIGDKEYNIKFNLGFVRFLDDKFPLKNGNIEGIGGGINTLMVQLEMRTPEALVNAIKAGTATEPQKPSNADIEAFLDSQEDLKWLFEGVSEGLESSPMTRDQMKLLNDQKEVAMKRQKAQQTAQ